MEIQHVKTASNLLTEKMYCPLYLETYLRFCYRSTLKGIEFCRSDLIPDDSRELRGTLERLCARKAEKLKM